MLYPLSYEGGSPIVAAQEVRPAAAVVLDSSAGGPVFGLGGDLVAARLPLGCA
jgi:hypothetical protein